MPKLPSVLRTRSAVLTDAAGETYRLERLTAEFAADARQVRILLTAGSRTLAALELSRKEAVALAEWLDQVATKPDA